MIIQLDIVSTQALTQLQIDREVQSRRGHTVHQQLCRIDLDLFGIKAFTFGVFSLI